MNTTRRLSALPGGVAERWGGSAVSASTASVASRHTTARRYGSAPRPTWSEYATSAIGCSGRCSMWRASAAVDRSSAVSVLADSTSSECGRDGPDAGLGGGSSRTT
jgi:hypothetical protein